MSKPVEIGSLDPESLWLRIAPALRRTIERRGWCGEVDDVIQDVAERFFSLAPAFATDDEALTWARLVAKRRQVDLGRARYSVPLGDVEPVTNLDAERGALDRIALDHARRFLDSRGAAEAWMVGADRSLPAKAVERMQLSRLRRELRVHLKNKVGWSVLIPRWRWFAPAVGALALAPLPYFVDIPFGEDRGPEPSHPTEAAPAARSAPQSVSSELFQAPKAAGAAPAVQAVPPPPPPTRTVATVPLPWGDASVREAPSPEGEPAPLFCGRGLYPLPDTCVDHPLRDS